MKAEIEFIDGIILTQACDLANHKVDNVILCSVTSKKDIFSVPVHLASSTAKRNGKRLRLCPPYREHLSQAFARYFMRVGLPINIHME